MSAATLVAPHETNEFRSLAVADSTGAPVTAYAWQITPEGTRPTGPWQAALTHAGMTGFAVSGLAAGSYWLWLRIPDGSYLVVPEPITFVLD